LLSSHTLVHSAEGDLYRTVVVDAFDRHGITLEPVPRSAVPARAAQAARDGEDAGAIVSAIGRAAGPPWRREHKDATLAALASVALTR
jgi:hypothetical protein